MDFGQWFDIRSGQASFFERRQLCKVRNAFLVHQYRLLDIDVFGFDIAACVVSVAMLAWSCHLSGNIRPVGRCGKQRKRGLYRQPSRLS
jgi:hypothetical protein